MFLFVKKIKGGKVVKRDSLRTEKQLEGRFAVGERFLYILLLPAFFPFLAPSKHLLHHSRPRLMPRGH